MCKEQCGSLQFSRCEHELADAQVTARAFGGFASEAYRGATFDAGRSGPNWHGHGRRLVMASAMLAGSVGLLSTGQAMAAECTDTDGDGWGWDGSASCEMSTRSNPGQEEAASNEVIEADPWPDALVDVTSSDEGDAAQATEEDRVENSDSDSSPKVAGPCVDSGPADDAWGWNGVESCRLDTTTNPEAHCLDVGAVNDGWGWNGFESCEIPIRQSAEPHSDNQLSENERSVSDEVGIDNASQGFVVVDGSEDPSGTAVLGGNQDAMSSGNAGSVGGGGNAGLADAATTNAAPDNGLPAGAVEISAAARGLEQTASPSAIAADIDESEDADGVSGDSGTAVGGVDSTSFQTQPETEVPTSESTNTSVEVNEDGNQVEVTRDNATGEVVGTREVSTDDAGREVVSISTPSGQTTTTTDLETNISISTFTNEDVETTVVSDPQTGVTETTVEYNDGTVETQIDTVTFSATETISPDGNIRSDVEFATGQITVTETDGETTREHNWSPDATGGGTGHTTEDGVVTSTYSTVENPDGTRTETHVEDGVKTETVYDGDEVVSQEETTVTAEDLEPEVEDDEIATEDLDPEIDDVVATEDVAPVVDIHDPFEFTVAPSGPVQTIPDEAVVAEDEVPAVETPTVETPTVGTPAVSDWELAVAIEAVVDGTATLAQLDVVTTALREQPDLVASTDPTAPTDPIAAPAPTTPPTASESPKSDDEPTVTTVNTHRDVHSLPSIDSDNNAGGDAVGDTAQGAADTYSGGDLGGEYGGL